MFVQTPSTEDASSADETLIVRRIATRREQFMPRGMLHSQFAALEETGPNENHVVLIERQPREIVTQILSALDLLERGQSPGQVFPRSSVRSV
jgi:hypothetical protein